jgi:hypothetical protein
MREVLGVGVVFHRLGDVIKKRTRLGVEVSQLLFQIAGAQLLLDLCLGQLSFFQVSLKDKPPIAECSSSSQEGVHSLD